MINSLVLQVCTWYEYSCVIDKEIKNDACEKVVIYRMVAVCWDTSLLQETAVVLTHGLPPIEEREFHVQYVLIVVTPSFIRREVGSRKWATLVEHPRRALDGYPRH